MQQQFTGIKSRFSAIKKSFILFGLFFSIQIYAQDLYEIQVYKSETEQAGVTEYELHSNISLIGKKESENGIAPSHHQLRETLEITHGFNDWFETGFYFFTTNTQTDGFNYVGSSFRPRVRVPDKWKCPVGLSLSMELQYMNPMYNANTWAWEIRPIIDKTIGNFYFAFNPTLERNFVGAEAEEGFIFSPNFKLGYNITPALQAGFEYYGEIGSISNIDPIPNQHHMLVPAIDWQFADRWEFNVGVMFGMSAVSEPLVFKTIIAREF